MASENPIHDLIHEHKYILKVVHGISVFDAALERNEPVDVELIRGVVQFMREFADQCHHAKEEKILFPAMADKGVPSTGCPLEGLLNEHVKGRQLVGVLDRANEAYAAGAAGAAEDLRTAIGGIQKLYPNHIWKEDEMVFPMAAKLFTANEMAKLAVDFAAAEQQFGKEHDRYVTFANGMEALLATAS